MWYDKYWLKPRLQRFLNRVHLNEREKSGLDTDSGSVNMIKINRASSIRSALITSGVCALLIVVWGVSLAQAAPSALPPRPTPVTPTPVPVSVFTSSGWAVIELHVQPAQAERWTVVQWQDALGGWHDVEGWRGTLDEVSNGVGKKKWWVARPNFDTGPFRWVIYQNQGGKLLAASKVFQLPGYENTAVVVEATLK